MTGGGLFQPNDGTTAIRWVFSLFLDLVRSRLRNPSIHQPEHISRVETLFPIYIHSVIGILKLRKQTSRYLILVFSSEVNYDREVDSRK